jgi:serine/threonine-protein kinase
MQRLGPYDLVEELGRGAMGVVYRARHRATGAERAVKVIDADLSDPEGLARFRREAETLARVDRHPNIVRVHESGAEGRVWYYAMELVSGKTLRKLLEGGALPPLEALELAAKVARALEHCHRNGVVHRDLKPDNVIVDAEGEPRLVDFGLVRDLMGQRLTRTGAFVGTPAYMAPEQIRGERASAATDVYALGVLLFEALSGTRPHAGRTLNDISAEILECRTIPLESLRPDLPVSLARLVRRCFSRDRAARPPSAGALAQELDEIASSMRSKKTVTIKTARRIRRGVVLLLLVAGAFAAATATLLVQRRLRAEAEREDAELRRQAAQACAAAARLEAETGSLAAVLRIDAALALVPELPPGKARTGAELDLAVARAWAALDSGRFRDAVAAADRLAALGLATPVALEASTIRARALIASGRSVEALDGLAARDDLEALHLRTRALIQLRRWDQVLTLETRGDPFVRGAQILAELMAARTRVPDKDAPPEIETDRARTLTQEFARLGPGAAELAPAVGVHAAFSAVLEYERIDDVERGRRGPEVVAPLAEYAKRLTDAWRPGASPFLVAADELKDVERTLVLLGAHLLAFAPARPLQALGLLVALREAAETIGSRGSSSAFPCVVRELIAERDLLEHHSGTLDPKEADRRLAKLATRLAEIRAAAGSGSVPPEVAEAVAELLVDDSEERATHGLTGLDTVLTDLEHLIDVRADPKIPHEEPGPVIDRWAEIHRSGYYWVRRAARLALRLAWSSESPEARDRLLARAQKHLAQARVIAKDDTDTRRELHQDEFFRAFVAGDDVEAEKIAANFDLDPPPVEKTVFDSIGRSACECYLVSALRKRQGRSEEAKLLHDRALSLFNAERTRDGHVDMWYFEVLH